MQNFKSEANEIIERYKRRAKKDKADFYNIATPSCMFSSLEKGKHTIRILAKNFGCNFVNKKFLEVGCGTGTNLCNLISWGVDPENLFGNDIFEPSLLTARQDVKGINLKKLKQAIPWTHLAFSRITLCPPLARKLENLPFLIRMLSACKLLNTHVIGFFKK